MATTPGTSTGARVDAPTGRIGEIVDSRYRITALLGQGGMGSVYRAEHLKIRKPVAIKLLNKELRRFPQISARLEREAFATGRLQHPNCVTVSDCGHMDDGTVYLVMELLDGTELGDVLDGCGHLEVRRALHIARQLLKGLAHAHDVDVVHRDIKPDNIVLVHHDDDPDFVKILDFGIAKLLGDAIDEAGGEQLTEAGLAVGTPYYMSPEQAFGKDIDGRSDIYSASVLLYEMITGYPPFDAEDKLQVLSMHVSRPVPAFRETNPDIDVPPFVEQLVMRGLDKKPDARYQTAGDYVAAIDAALAQLTQRAPSPPMAAAPPPPMVAAPPPMMAPARHVVVTPVSTAHIGLPAPPDTARRSWSRNQLLAVGGGVAVLLIVIILAATAGPSEQSGGEYLPEKPAAAEPAEPTTAAVEALAEGHASAKLEDERAATDAYIRAIDAHGPYAEDRKLRDYLATWLDTGGRDAVDAAIDLMRAIISKTGDRDAQRQLIDVASRHETLYTRYKAFTLAEELGIDKEIDHLQSYVLDLQQSPKCEYRRRTVEKLRKLGDKKAIPALKKAQKRYVKGGLLGLSTENANGCLVKDARAAIEHLEGL